MRSLRAHQAESRWVERPVDIEDHHVGLAPRRDQVRSDIGRCHDRLAQSICVTGANGRLNRRIKAIEVRFRAPWPWVLREETISQLFPSWFPPSVARVLRKAQITQLSENLRGTRLGYPCHARQGGDPGARSPAPDLTSERMIARLPTPFGSVTRLATGGRLLRRWRETIPGARSRSFPDRRPTTSRYRSASSLATREMNGAVSSGCPSEASSCLVRWSRSTSCGYGARLRHSATNRAPCTPSAMSRTASAPLHARTGVVLDAQA